jgi:hypothetical protein
MWQGRKDSNPRMPESKSGALTNLATPLESIPQLWRDFLAENLKKSKNSEIFSFSNVFLMHSLKY